jgi:hypothetical protein
MVGNSGQHDAFSNAEPATKRLPDLRTCKSQSNVAMDGSFTQKKQASARSRIVGGQ